MRMDRKIRARINIASSGDNLIIAPQGLGNMLEIDHIDFLASGGANTVTLKDGATTIVDYDLLTGQGYTLDFNNIDRNKLMLSSNSTFTINLLNSTKVQGLVLAAVSGE